MTTSAANHKAIPQSDSLLSVLDACKKLGGIGRTTFDRWRALEGFPKPFYAEGRARPKFRASDLDAWIAGPGPQ